MTLEEIKNLDLTREKKCVKLKKKAIRKLKHTSRSKILKPI